MNEAIPLARLEGVSKSFGSLLAVDDVTVEFLPGRVRAILGENGAGKTTVMKVLAGLLVPDEGAVFVQGRRRDFGSRKDAVGAGIAFVQQHFSLIEELSCVDNLLLGNPTAGFRISRSHAVEGLEILASELGISVPQDEYVRSLSIGERQRLEILIALSWGAQILILDEPTASLGPAEFGSLKEIIHQLCERGLAVAYISHKLPEIEAVADDVTVMRHGAVVWQGECRVISAREMAWLMVGDLPSPIQRPDSAPGEVITRMRKVSSHPDRTGRGLQEVSLEVRGGEVVGVAGVDGNGQKQLARILARLDSPASGQIEPLSLHVAYIPEDRAGEGLALEASLSDNAIVRVHGELAHPRTGWLSLRRIAGFVVDVLQRFGVKGGAAHLPAAELSGGNQQRLVLGRELAGQPNLIVAHNPTRGLDVKSCTQIRERLLEARSIGAGVVLISPDLEELMEIADRLVVLYGGQLIASLSATEADPARLAELMAGASA